MLPSRKNCFGLLKKHRMPENIVQHSLAVEKVAVFLAKKLREAGEQVDAELVGRAALLHDIDKAKTLLEGCRQGHGTLSKKILEAEGFPEIGQIALKHNLFNILEKKPFANWEEKLVYYADKRVTHNQIVSLDERFNYLLERYGRQKKDFEKISACKERVEALEREIFSRLKASPTLEGLK